MQSAVEYFEGDELAASVFDKYALRDLEDKKLEQNPDEMHRRLAREFSRIEQGKFKEPWSEDFIYDLFKDFGAIIPQGSPMAGVGSKQFVSTSNCFVVESPLDSYAGICYTDEQLVQICKRRGGVGTDVSNIRPAEMPTSNAARRATGVPTFCERFSNSIREVGQEGRRGALLLSLSVHHPEVVEFARMKLDSTKVTGANVSVRLTDEFLEAVEKDEEYEQRWPVDSVTPRISKRVKAREVWKSIIHCAWKRAEPGLFFWGRILRESPADCYASLGYATTSSNPCGEILMCADDACRLLLQNLFYFVVNPFTPEAYFDFPKFYLYSQYAQRLMDDLVDLELEAISRIIKKVEDDPEPAHIKERELNLWKTIREKCANGRRTGTGITALGDAMAGVGIRYGTDESIAFAERIYQTMKFACYRSSVDMAKEVGPFPIWQASLEQDCPFLNRFKDETIQFGDCQIGGQELWEDMQKYGRRNIALLTTAPAGSVSILAGPRPYFGSTSGIEPLFTDRPYTRRKKVNHSNKDARVDFVDEKGDKWTNFDVYHSKLKMWMDVTGETDITKSPYHGCCAEDLDWRQRVKLQAAAQKHICHSISSTTNVPEDITEEKVAEIYETAWKSGCKGITVYRKGCRDGVLVDKQAATPQERDAKKRPKKLPCDIHHWTVKKEPFLVTVGLLDGKPFEVFACQNSEKEDLLVKKKHAHGVLQKVKRGHYQLLSQEGEALIEDVTDHLTDTEEALTRMTSTALRHKVNLNFVVHQLDKTEGELCSLAKALARSLKKYIADGTKISGELCQSCGQDALVRQEGCVACKSCGFSKC